MSGHFDDIVKKLNDDAEARRAEARKEFDDRVAALEAERVAGLERIAADKRDRFEAETRAEFLSSPINTEADWLRLREQLLDARRLRMGSPEEQARKRLQATGEYSAL